MLKVKSESALRRALQRDGYSLHKSRSAQSVDNLGGYMIVNDETNFVAAGFRFDFDLADVQAWMDA